jgi:hypothetical protein
MGRIDTPEKMSSSLDGHFFCPQSHAFFPRVKKNKKKKNRKKARGQFHQQYTSGFCANIFAPKKYKPKI